MQMVVGGCLAQKDRDTVVRKAGHVDVVFGTHNVHRAAELLAESREAGRPIVEILEETVADDHDTFPSALPVKREVPWAGWVTIRSEEHTSELQSLMRLSYAVFCLKKKKK